MKYVHPQLLRERTNLLVHFSRYHPRLCPQCYLPINRQLATLVSREQDSNRLKYGWKCSHHYRYVILVTNLNSYVGPRRVGAPSYGESWICLCIFTISYSCMMLLPGFPTLLVHGLSVSAFIFEEEQYRPRSISWEACTIELSQKVNVTST